MAVAALAFSGILAPTAASAAEVPDEEVVVFEVTFDSAKLGNLASATATNTATGELWAPFAAPPLRRL